jgi:hypothetical protein
VKPLAMEHRLETSKHDHSVKPLAMEHRLETSKHDQSVKPLAMEHRLETSKHDQSVQTMFGSSLPPVVCRRVHVLFTLFVFVCIYLDFIDKHVYLVLMVRLLHQMISQSEYILVKCSTL